jgi:hypothetical protein
MTNEVKRGIDMTFPKFMDALGQDPFDNDRANDFVLDAKTDENLPDPKNWEELEDYLVSLGAGDEVIAGAAYAWKYYPGRKRKEQANDRGN